MKGMIEFRGNTPFLLPHLFESIREIPAPNLLAVLELQKFIPPVSRHVNQHITSRVTAQSFPSRYIFTQSISQKPYEVLNCDFVSPIIYLNVVTVQIKRAVCIVVDGAWKRIARIAGHVVGQHEDNLGVGDAETLDGAVEGEDIG